MAANEEAFYPYHRQASGTEAAPIPGEPRRTDDGRRLSAGWAGRPTEAAPITREPRTTGGSCQQAGPVDRPKRRPSLVNLGGRTTGGNQKWRNKQRIIWCPATTLTFLWNAHNLFPRYGWLNHVYVFIQQRVITWARQCWTESREQYFYHAERTPGIFSRRKCLSRYM
jgi:hypothetical protein